MTHTWGGPQVVRDRPADRGTLWGSVDDVRHEALGYDAPRAPTGGLEGSPMKRSIQPARTRTQHIGAGRRRKRASRAGVERDWVALLGCLVVLPLLPFACATAHAPVRAGIAISVHGRVAVARDTLPELRTIQSRDDVFAGDRICTERDAFVRLLLRGKVLFTLREQSEITLAEKRTNAEVILQRGQLALQVDPLLLAPQESVEVSTPNTMLNMGGGLLVVNVQTLDNDYLTDIAAVHVPAPVSVCTRGGLGCVNLSTGQAITLRGAAFIPVRELDPAEANRLARTAEPSARPPMPAGYADHRTRNRHFKEYGANVGAKTPAEYEGRAADFLTGPKPPETFEKVRANGDVVRYNPKTEEFGIVRSDGTILIYLKPDPRIHGKPTNLDYFNAQ